MKVLLGRIPRSPRVASAVYMTFAKFAATNFRFKPFWEWAMVRNVNGTGIIHVVDGSGSHRAPVRALGVGAAVTCVDVVGATSSGTRPPLLALDKTFTGWSFYGTDVRGFADSPWLSAANWVADFLPVVTGAAHRCAGRCKRFVNDQHR